MNYIFLLILESKEMQTRSQSKRQRVASDDEMVQIANPSFDVDALLKGLNLTQTGTVRVDDILLKKLKAAQECEEVEEEEEPNPFQHIPEFLDVMQDGKDVDLNFLESCSRRFHSDKNGVNMAEMIGNLPIDILALRRSKMKEDNWEYNITSSVTPRVTDQHHSGRCWSYSSLNVMRYPMIKKFNLQNTFEFSAAYIFFYDKIERANFFLESMWSMKDRTLDDRYVKIFTNEGSFMCDGGYFSYFLNLIRKYGIVPQSIYNDSFNCYNSDFMNETLQTVLNKMTLTIHQHKESWTDDEFKKQKREWMTTVYNLMVRFMSEPPRPNTEFTWTYKDLENHHQEVKNLTPKLFYQRLVPHEHDTKITLIHDPRKPENYYKTHFVEYGNNVVGGLPVNFLNVPMDVIKKAVTESLKNEDCCWFANDVGKCLDYESNTLDTQRYDYEAVLGTKVEFSKEDMLTMGISAPTHAMVLCGVDVDDSDEKNPVYKKWRVENSWGIDCEMEWAKDHGYWRMTDDHFEKYTYMAVVDLKYLDEETCENIVANKETIVYKPWDTFGTVAMNKTCKHCSKGKK